MTSLFSTSTRTRSPKLQVATTYQTYLCFIWHHDLFPYRIHIHILQSIEYAHHSSPRWQHCRLPLRPVDAFIRRKVQSHQAIGHIGTISEDQRSRTDLSFCHSDRGGPRPGPGASRSLGAVTAACCGARRQTTSQRGGPATLERGGSEGAQGHRTGDSAVLEEGRGEKEGASRWVCGL